MHVIHAVGPNAHENNSRQECFDLVQSTVLCSLEHTEHVLNATSIALPAISSGLFGVPKIDIAQALYEAIVKFDETEPTFVKTVHIVNLDKDVTGLINREFVWWFGGASEVCVNTVGRPIIIQKSEATEFSQGEGGPLGEVSENGIQGVQNLEAGNNKILEAAEENKILVVRRNKKRQYIPEKFTYFFGCDSPFSQHFICEFVINGKIYNCTEKWMIQQKTIIFGDPELAERIMQMNEPKMIKRAGRSIGNFDQSVWERYAYNIVHEGNRNKFG